jgi:arylsulfatase A-like enzyme
VKPGTTSDHVWAFWDFLPTACDITGVETPKGLDGLSILPTLTGRGKQAEHAFLYWEFHEGGSIQGVRHKQWKAIRPIGKPLQLYDVMADPGEKNEVAAKHPTVVADIEAYLKTARTESQEFPLQQPKKK